jgi:hypothetical protein
MEGDMLMRDEQARTGKEMWQLLPAIRQAEGNDGQTIIRIFDKPVQILPALPPRTHAYRAATNLIREEFLSFPQSL